MNTYLRLNVRMLAFAAAFALAAALLVPILTPALTARADSNASVTATAATAVPGAATAIGGSGFAAGETVLVNFGTRSATAIADGSGTISGVTLPIPSVPAGLQFVSAFGETSGRWGLAYLYVTGFTPSVQPAAYYILPGTALSFSGSGFAPNETVTARWNSVTIGTFTTDGSGAFSGAASASLPASVSNTTATVTFTGAISHASASVDLTVGQLYPSITPSSWYTGAGSIISLSGTGFAPHEGIAVTIGSQHASTTADAAGAFSIGSIQLPKIGGAPLTIAATGADSGASASVAIFVTGVTPWITFSTYWAQGGAPLTVGGNGFLGGEQVGLYARGASIGTTTADTQGSFSYSTAIPFAPSGPLTISAVGADSTAQASAELTVAPVYTSLQLGSYAGAPGTAIDFIGSGYLPNEPIEVTTDRTGGTAVASFSADASGSFNNSSYTVPGDATEGNLVLTVTGMHSFDQKSITYYVTGK